MLLMSHFSYTYIRFNRCPTFDTLIDSCSAALFAPELVFQTVFVFRPSLNSLFYILVFRFISLLVTAAYTQSW